MRPCALEKMWKNQEQNHFINFEANPTHTILVPSKIETNLEPGTALC